MSDFDEIRSPFLRKVLERGGINDDEVTSLLIVERYHRRPEPTNSVIALMLAAIDKELPIEAAVVRREIDLGRALTDKELKQEIMAGCHAAERGLALRGRKLDRAIGMYVTASP